MIPAVSALLSNYAQSAQLKSALPSTQPVLESITSPKELTGVQAAQPASDSFGGMLERAIGEINAKQTTAADAVSALQSGQGGSLHQAVIAMEEASVSFQLMVEVRNKLLESYQELMRMQI